MEILSVEERTLQTFNDSQLKEFYFSVCYVRVLNIKNKSWLVFDDLLQFFKHDNIEGLLVLVDDKNKCVGDDLRFPFWDKKLFNLVFINANDGFCEFTAKIRCPLGMRMLDQIEKWYPETKQKKKKNYQLVLMSWWYRTRSVRHELPNQQLYVRHHNAPPVHCMNIDWLINSLWQAFTK